MAEILQQKLLTEGKKFYDVWMHEVSDQIQALALAYAERFCLEASMDKLSKLSNPKAKVVLALAIRLHCLSFVKDNLGWYLIQGVISQKAASSVESDFQQAVQDVLPHMNEFIEAFNLPKIPQLAPPIVRDYVKFNEQSDPDNVDAAGDLFDFRKGPKL